MICSVYNDSRYFIPEKFDISDIGFIADDDSDDLTPMLIVSIICYRTDPEGYDCYCNLPQEERNDYMNAERSCEFITCNGDSYIIGFNYLRASSLPVSHVC